jgi:serine O-acetyltransferase
LTGCDRAAQWLLDRLFWLRALASKPLLWILTASDQRAIVTADASRWATVLGVEDGPGIMARLLFAFPEFRSIFYHRLAAGNPTGALLARLASHVWKGVPGLDLGKTSIGAGLFVSHGQGTILSAEHIGTNLWVHHGVTVGWDYRGERRPIIGDNVFIGAGAKVLGAITVGDGAQIGANAVVMCDVPAGATAVGIPAQILPPGESRGRVLRPLLTVDAPSNLSRTRLGRRSPDREIPRPWMSGGMTSGDAV